MWIAGYQYIDWRWSTLFASDYFCMTRVCYIPLVDAEKERRTLIGPQVYLDRQHPLLKLP